MINKSIDLAIATLLNNAASESKFEVIEEPQRGLEVLQMDLNSLPIEITDRYKFFDKPVKKFNKGLKLGSYNSKSKNKAQ